MAEPTAQVPVARIPTTVLKINKKEFVSGLLWTVIQNTMNPMKEAREFGKRYNPSLDVVVIRKQSRTQGGFVAKGIGAHKGMYSLAAVLADGYGPSFLGVFRVLDRDDHYVLVGVNEADIVPQFDFNGTREEVENRLNKKLGITEWKRIVAPADFGLGGEDIDLETALRRCTLKRSHRLKPLTFGLSEKTLIQYGVVAAIGLACAGAWWAWNSYEEQLEQERAAREAEERKAEQARLSRELQKQISLASLDKPWTFETSANEYLEHCEQSIGAAPLALGGWSFVQAKCDAAGVLVTYKRELGGTTGLFVSDAKAMFGAGVSPEFDSYDGIANIRFHHNLKAGGEDLLTDANDRRISFITHFQQQAITANIKQQESKLVRLPTLPNGRPWPKEIAPPPPTWKTFAFSIETKYVPSEAFENLPTEGVRPDFMEVKLAGNELVWTVKGKFYGI